MKRPATPVTIGRPLLAAFLIAASLLTLLKSAADAQQIRRVPIRQSDHDRKKTDLNREEGAVYLEGIVKKELKVKVKTAAPVYSSLIADRWLGNLIPNQEATLLAISEKAYRVRARAQQGQVAGWIGKHAVDGIDAKFEENLTKLYERQLLVDDLIANQQIAMGMTTEEVRQSLGEPDQRNSQVNKEGRTDSFEYITYEKVPQTTTVQDRFGRPFLSTVYVKVESGKVTIDFEKGVVSSIKESEGAPKLGQGAVRIVPPPIILF